MKRLSLVFLALLCFSLVSLPVFAAESPAFSFALSEAEGREGDAVELSVRYDGSLGEIGAFLVRVEFDPDIFEYQRVKTAPVVRDAHSLTLPGEGWVGSGYVMKSRTECLSSPGDTFTYRFKVREGAELGETAFSASVYQIVSPDSDPLGAADMALPYVILPPPSGEAALVSLSPAVGELEPAFSPDCFAYTMTVPFEVASLSFFAEPAEGAVCKINRKNLGAGGSETEFLLTVTAEDGKTKAVYQIMVRREERAVSPKPSAVPRPTAEPKPVKTPASEAKADFSQPETSGPPAVAALSPIPRQEREQPSASPIPSVLPGTAAMPPESVGAEGSASRPSVAVRGGEASLFPLSAAIVFIIVIVGISRPFSGLICDWLKERKEKKEKK